MCLALIVSGTQALWALESLTDEEAAFERAFQHYGGLEALGISNSGVEKWDDGGWRQSYWKNRKTTFLMLSPKGVIYPLSRFVAYYYNVARQVSQIGYPKSKEKKAISSGGTEFVYQLFENEGGTAAIVQHLDGNLAGKTFLVRNGVYAKWKNLGSGNSSYGLPITEEQPIPGIINQPDENSVLVTATGYKQQFEDQNFIHRDTDETNAINVDEPAPTYVWKAGGWNACNATTCDAT